MTRCLNVFGLSIALFTFTASAGTIEVAQWIPWQFISTEIYKQPIKIAVQESELQLTFAELTPKLIGVKIDVNGDLNNLSFGASGIKSEQSFSASIKIEQLIIDQFILREFNGNQIQVHLKATCAPMSIVIPELRTKTETIFVKQDSTWRPELTEVGMAIPDNSWQLSKIECSGIGGVGEEIASSLTAALKNPAAFEAILKSWLSHELKLVFNEGWANLLEATGPDLTITGMGKPSDLGLTVFAELTIKNARNIILNAFDESHLSAMTPQLVFSNQGFEALLEDKFMAMAPQKFNLQKVDAFASLMRSRMKQYFAWPDLRRFPSSTPFLLSTNTNQSQLKLRPKAAGKWLANLNANGVMETVIGGSPIDYIQFGIGVATEVSIKVNAGKLQIASGTSQLELAWSYGFLYQMIYKPNKRIAIDILKSGLNEFFTNQAVEEVLPVLRFQEREWKLQNWQQQNEIITMDWL